MEVSTKDDATIISNLKAFVQSLAPSRDSETDGKATIRLTEEFNGRLRYEIPHACQLSLGDIFKQFEQRREDLKITDYSVSQTTLDQVFVSFAKQQDQISD